MQIKSVKCVIHAYRGENAKATVSVTMTDGIVRNYCDECMEKVEASSAFCIASIEPARALPVSLTHSMRQKFHPGYSPNGIAKCESCWNPSIDGGHVNRMALYYLILAGEGKGGEGRETVCEDHMIKAFEVCGDAIGIKVVHLYPHITDPEVSVCPNGYNDAACDASCGNEFGYGH